MSRRLGCFERYTSQHQPTNRPSQSILFNSSPAQLCACAPLPRFWSQIVCRMSAAASRPLVVDDPGLLPTEQAAAQLSRAVLLRRGFTLLAGCLSDSGSIGSVSRDEMAALLVKEGLWSRRAQLVLIYSLVWPWAGGLLPRASDGDEVEQCERRKGEGCCSDFRALPTCAFSSIRCSLVCASPPLSVVIYIQHGFENHVISLPHDMILGQDGYACAPI